MTFKSSRRANIYYVTLTDLKQGHEQMAKTIKKLNDGRVYRLEPCRERLGILLHATSTTDAVQVAKDIMKLAGLKVPSGTPHKAVPHGQCDICGHYGDDCTGRRK